MFRVSESKIGQKRWIKMPGIIEYASLLSAYDPIEQKAS